MPRYNGLGLDDHEGILPAAPRPTQRDPEQTLFGLPSRNASRSRQHGDLLAEGDVLEHQVRARPAQRPNAVDQEGEDEMKRVHGRRY